MKYKVFEGYDHFNSKPLNRVEGADKDYVGEWSEDKTEAYSELVNLSTPVMGRKLETLRTILEGCEGSRFPEAEKLAYEIVLLIGYGVEVPSNLAPLPLVINYTA